MRLAVCSMVVLVAALLDVSIVERISVGDVHVDLVIVVVVTVALLTNSVVGAVNGFLGGAALALFAGIPLGSHALVAMLVGYLVGRWGEVLVTEEHPVPPLVAAAFGTGVMQVGRPVVEFLVRPGASEVGVDWGSAFANVLVGALASVPVYAAVRSIVCVVPDIGVTSGDGSIPSKDPA